MPCGVLIRCCNARAPPVRPPVGPVGSLAAAPQRLIRRDGFRMHGCSTRRRRSSLPGSRHEPRCRRRRIAPVLHRGARLHRVWRRHAVRAATPEPGLTRHEGVKRGTRVAAPAGAGKHAPPGAGAPCPVRARGRLQRGWPASLALWTHGVAWISPSPPEAQTRVRIPLGPPHSPLFFLLVRLRFPRGCAGSVCGAGRP